jgi:hypothetical protein
MTFWRWLPTFLAFPLAGLVAVEVLGSFDDALSGAAGGLLAGSIIGAGQWLALRSEGIGARWVAYTALGMAAGLALTAAVTGAGTTRADVIVTGLLTGAAVGAAQSPLLSRRLATVVAWTAATAAAWALGWLATSLIIVDIERGYHVFGAGGAVTATVLTGVVLRHILAAPAGRVSPSPAVA